MLRKWIGVMVCAVSLIALCGHGLGQQVTTKSVPYEPFGLFVVLGFNDLGMHCFNQDCSEFMILPPYNNLHAQVVARTWPRPRLVNKGITVSYRYRANTESASKTNFWTYAQGLLGLPAPLPPNIGLAGKGLAGTLTASGTGWLAAGIPITPQNDDGTIDPFQLATVRVTGPWGIRLAETKAVTPVSWELRCDLCHHGLPDAPVSPLEAHDLLHGTTLYNPGNQTPVLCGGCHAQPELGCAGQPGVSSLSLAMHRAHSPRMMDVAASVPNGNICYACHPGPDTQCLRDVHSLKGMQCGACHAPNAVDAESEMLAVGDPARVPWTDMPRCDNCHNRPGWSYEQPGTLFKNSIGHGGLYCEACHNSTHAILPARDAADNLQSVMLQKSAGTIAKCTVCHLFQPFAAFRHRTPLPAWPWF